MEEAQHASGVAVDWAEITLNDLLNDKGGCRAALDCAPVEVRLLVWKQKAEEALHCSDRWLTPALSTVRGDCRCSRAPHRHDGMTRVVAEDERYERLAKWVPLPIGNVVVMLGELEALNPVGWPEMRERVIEHFWERALGELPTYRSLCDSRLPQFREADRVPGPLEGGPC